MALVTATTDYSGFKHVDLVIEAVFEDLALKHQMVKDIERVCGPETIFASQHLVDPHHRHRRRPARTRRP